MQKTRISDCYGLNLKSFIDHKGRLDVIEDIKDLNNQTLNFKRCYILRDFNQEQIRGVHAHKNLYQVFLTFHGSFNINLFDGFESNNITLKDGSGFLVVPGIWRELSCFAKNTIIVVMASDLYDVKDYIYCKNKFIDYKKNNYFNEAFF
mgnify:FL=1